MNALPTNTALTTGERRAISQLALCLHGLRMRQCRLNLAVQINHVVD